MKSIDFYLTASFFLFIIFFCRICGEPPFTGQDEDGLYDSIRKGDLDFSTDAWQRISDEGKMMRFSSSLIPLG